MNEEKQVDGQEWKNALDEWKNIDSLEQPLATTKEVSSFAQLEPIYFAECWALLKCRNLDVERRKLQSNDVCQTNRCCFPCRTSLNQELQEEKETILALTKVPYNNEDAVHNKMLSTFFKRIRPKLDPPKRFGPHWEIVGFQGDDPATDLRGAGIFGLLQLLYLVSDESRRKNVTAIFKLSQDTLQNFPLAVVGLNFTKLSLLALRKRKLDRISNRKNSVTWAVNELYVGIFYRFYNIWTKEPKKTIENFGFVLQEIEKSVLKNAPSVMNEKIKSIREEIDKSNEKESIEFDVI